MSKIGFIGCGNMSQAMMGGIIQSGLVPASNVIASDLFAPNRELCAKKYGITVTADNKEAVQDVDMLVLAVKPHIYPIVIAEIKDLIKPTCIVVSIAAGQTVEALEEMFNPETKIIKTMPNTPAMVGEGMTAAIANAFVTAEEKEFVTQVLTSFGKLEWVEEYMMDAVTAVSGSSPAYVFMFIEAMADAAVLGGLPRQQAYKFAAQAVLGSAKMVLESGKHPAELKDNVCSPGGTTIEAVAKLEKEGFRTSIISAMKACMKKSKKMSK